MSFHFSLVALLRCGSVIVDLGLNFNSTVRERGVVDILRNAASNNQFGIFKVNASSITGTRPETGKATTTTPTTPTPTSPSDSMFSSFDLYCYY